MLKRLKKSKKVFIFRSARLSKFGIFRYRLASIFGIGLSKSSHICDMLGFGKTVRIEILSNYKFFSVIYLIRNFYLTDLFLKKYIYDSVKFFVELNTYKGVRLIFSLPYHGQRTKSNARTAKRNREVTDKDKFSLSNFTKKILSSKK